VNLGGNHVVIGAIEGEGRAGRIHHRWEAERTRNILFWWR
jgi:hypothetical protein